MKSKWYESKDKAITLRKKGVSIRKIEHQLKIPRSTLSGWFREIELSVKQKKELRERWKKGLIKARKKAILWHNAEKQKRLQKAESEAVKVLDSINTTDSKILELTLAILYLGEGTKKTHETAIGSSDPLILKFFLSILKNVYNLDLKQIRCQLSLRADQNPEKMKRFWAKELNLSLKNFKHVNIDKRTLGSKTYPYYKGVCEVRYGNVAIQRKLLYMSRIFCERVVENHLDS